MMPRPNDGSSSQDSWTRLGNNTIPKIRQVNLLQMHPSAAYTCTVNAKPNESVELLIILDYPTR